MLVFNLYTYELQNLFSRALERPFLSYSLTHAHSYIKKVAPRSAHAPSALQLKFFTNLLYDNYIIMNPFLPQNMVLYAYTGRSRFNCPDFVGL